MSFFTDLLGRAIDNKNAKNQQAAEKAAYDRGDYNCKHYSWGQNTEENERRMRGEQYFVNWQNDIVHYCKKRGNYLPIYYHFPGTHGEFRRRHNNLVPRQHVLDHCRYAGKSGKHDCREM